MGDFLGKIYFNPKFHSPHFFKVLPMLFQDVYFNAVFTDLDESMIQMANKKIIIPVFLNEESVPAELSNGNYLIRKNIVNDNEFEFIDEELSKIGARNSFMSTMKTNYTKREFNDFFQITNWDLIVSNYLKCNELGTWDLINLRNKLKIYSLQKVESIRKPDNVGTFLKYRNIKLPANLRIHDLQKFRDEKLFTSFNDWLDKEIINYDTNEGELSLELPEHLDKSFERINRKYSEKTAVQGALFQFGLTFTAVLTGFNPIMSVAGGFAASTMPKKLHNIYAKERWVYWLLNIESAKRYE